ncbi:EamA/RhaT family transporter [Aestuariivirga litoralis]|uniref:EamA/RhaT family transporter n=1 Tax=Aestuariivirga litoralis TaxID=2650924 RepID=A0A2W2B5L7_9HYPH|nr:DMT family transporter [Aestuariivirga litoralis]PZF75418.1 EamA/RhaT family transporter [Aestuariivirga litoralis]
MTTPASSRTLVGIGLMLTAMAVLPFLDAIAKYLGQQGVPVMQIVWARLFFGAFLTMPFALKLAGPRGLIPNMPLMHAVRATLMIAATAFFFMGLHYLSIADTLAIFFVQPLIVTLLSPLVLGETVGIRRWVAVIIGFIGTLIIIRPGFQELNPGVFMALASGFCLAIYLLLTRRISGSAPAMVTTFYTSLMGAIIMSVIVVFVWQTPTPAQWGFFVLLSAIANGGHYLIIRAYDHAEASLLAPLAYTEMIMATVLGWYIFGDFPDLWTFVGVGILIACAIYISWRERVRHVEPIRDFEQP